MYGRQSSKSGLFLIELIILILFFSVASAICVRLFVTAQMTAVHSTDLSRATLLSQSAAELFKISNNEEADFVKLLSAEEEDGAFVSYYDADWNTLPAKQENAMYCMKITLSSGAPVITAQIEVTRLETSEQIFSLAAKKLSAA